MDDLPERLDGFVDATDPLERRTELAEKLSVARVLSKALLDTGKRIAPSVKREQFGGKIVARVKMSWLCPQGAAIAIERTLL